MLAKVKENMKDAQIQLVNRSLVADIERAVPDIIWGGAEGEAQKRRSNKDELLDAEKRQTGVLIK